MMIPYGRQSIREEDIQAVVRVLRSDFLTQGPAIPKFEGAVAQLCGAKHAAAVSSATAGLHLACLALDVGVGDLIWTSANTFAASANCARYCGADVDFVDIDPETLNLSVDALAVKLTSAKRAGKLPKALIGTHFGGQPFDLRRVKDLSDEYGFAVIEDAAHAIGASYGGSPVGAGKYSRMTVFSFHPVKIMTTAEGGMVMTNDENLHRRIVSLRSHGITRDSAQLKEKNPEGWYYEQLELGYNYRITDLQAALGSSQLGRINQFIQRRRELVARYDRMLDELPVKTQKREPGVESAHHLYVIRLDSSRVRRSRRDVFDRLREAGIGVNLHYLPVYLHPYYKSLGFRAGLCPEAERYMEEAITLPLYFDLTETEQDFVIENLKQALS